jgi:AcrR family transcriptional regulator
MDTAQQSPDASVGRKGGGRPTRAQAERRDERLIEVAEKLFLERGFEATSIDAVAEAAGVSKPTVYARYRDKADLFGAVLRRGIQSWLAPISAAAEAQAREAGRLDIETTLHNLSRQLLAIDQQPNAGALKRILVAQSLHFPELARLAYEEGFLRCIKGVAGLLEKFAAVGQIRVDDPELTAELFLNLVFGRRDALHGLVTDPERRERRRQAAVELFLNGVRMR